MQDRYLNMNQSLLLNHGLEKLISVFYWINLDWGEGLDHSRQKAVANSHSMAVKDIHKLFNHKPIDKQLAWNNNSMI